MCTGGSFHTPTVLQTYSFEACAQWHQSRSIRAQAETTSDGYGLEIGHLEAALVRIQPLRCCAVPLFCALWCGVTLACASTGAAAGENTDKCVVGDEMVVQAAGRRAIEVARSSSLASEAMMGLMRTVEIRMGEANRDNDSVYMQPKVPVARLPPIAMHNMAKVR